MSSRTTLITDEIVDKAIRAFHAPSDDRWEAWRNALAAVWPEPTFTDDLSSPKSVDSMTMQEADRELAEQLETALAPVWRPAEARLKRHGWICRAPGADGLGLWDHNARGLRLIHSFAYEQDGEIWEHISVSRRDGVMPSWEQTRDIFHEVAGDDALGIIVVAPKSEHVNIAEVSHVWHCLTKQRPIPDFTHGKGTI